MYPRIEFFLKNDVSVYPYPADTDTRIRIRAALVCTAIGVLRGVALHEKLV